MSDFNSSLPIRSESDGTDARVHTKIVDYADPSGTNKQAQVSDNALHVKATGQQVGGGTETLLLSETGAVVVDGVYDGTNNTNPSNIGQILHARAAAPADTDQTIRATAANPSADNIDPANVWAADSNCFLYGWEGASWDKLGSTSGSLNVNVTNALTVNLDGVYVNPTNLTPDTVGAIFHARAATPDATNQTFRSTGASPSSDNVAPANVYAIDANSFLMGWDATDSNWDRAQIFAGKLGMALFDATGTAFSATNPLPVSVSQDLGTDVHDYQTSSAVAAGATVNHDYTVTALKTLKLGEIEAAGSGKIKVELKIETGVGTGVYANKGVWFNSTANPNVDTVFARALDVAAGVKVRISITNKDNQAQDVYSFINGYEV